MDNKDPVSYEFFMDIRRRNEMKNVTKVFTSDAATPPIRMDETVKEFCIIRFEIDTPWDSLPQITSPTGVKLRRATGLRLTMSFGGLPMWALKAGASTAEHPVNVEYKGA